MNHNKIKRVIGREILDSRGNPTVEAQVELEDGTIGIASVPSGASTGEHEAFELRDSSLKYEDNHNSTDNQIASGKNDGRLINIWDRYNGKGVLRAVYYINSTINQALCGIEITDIRRIDDTLLRLDGTKTKAKLGANTTLAVSIACCVAAARSLNIPLYTFLGGISGEAMPLPMMNIINGGRHAANNLIFQEFMIIPIGACCFREALRIGAEVYHSLREVLLSRGLSVGVGDEGGFAPELLNPHDAFVLMNEAVKKAGYEPGKDVVYALDAAASEFYNKDSGLYCFEKSKQVDCSCQTDYECNCEDNNRVNGFDKNDCDCLAGMYGKDVNVGKCDGYQHMNGTEIEDQRGHVSVYSDRACNGTGYINQECVCDGMMIEAGSGRATRVSEGISGDIGGSRNEHVLSCGADEVKRQPDTLSCTCVKNTDQMIQLYKKLVEEFPIISIEDPLQENDWEGWAKLTKELGNKIMLVGDDLYVTNKERIAKGIRLGCGNTVLIKPNQIGTVSETIEAIRIAKNGGFKTIISHRSGETEDSFIADLSIALNTGWIKIGAPSRGERTAKYNRLLRIEEELGNVLQASYGKAAMLKDLKLN